VIFPRMSLPRRVLPLLLAPLAACGASGSAAPARDRAAPAAPFAAGKPVDHLIQPGEHHFAHLWQLTNDGENGEAYWSGDGSALVFQRRCEDRAILCDRIYLLERGDREPRQLSNGQGVTTCSYFLAGDRRVLFASTHGEMAGCPPPIDPRDFQKLGYFWRVFPEFDIWSAARDGSDLRPLVSAPGYDAEATLAPDGSRIVFTSTRSGDIELWTCDAAGGDLRQVTSTPGYDGGAFFSHDGKKLVFRSQAFTPGKEAEEIATYRELLAQWKVQPSRMELQIADADGSNRRTLGPLGGASFAPYFFPDDRRVIFSTNHHDPAQPPAPKREFDLFAIGVDGQGLERITTSPSFDSFPMFSPDGRYLAFASNRGQAKAGETNLFLAEWK